MKHERERKEQESKKSQKLDFVSAGTQPGTVFAPQKPNIPIPGVYKSVCLVLFVSATSLQKFDGFLAFAHFFRYSSSFTS